MGDRGYGSSSSDFTPNEPSEDEEDGQIADPEMDEINSWNPNTFIGDREDERRLNAMNELERETVIASRQAKVNSDFSFSLIS